MSRFFFMLDSLHTLEQKGVSSHAVANALVTILQETIGRRNAGRDFMEKAWPPVWEDMRKVTTLPQLEEITGLHGRVQQRCGRRGS